MVVPFSMTNAHATFMLLMNHVLHPYFDKFVVIFVDDVLVYSNTKEEHKKHLFVVLQLLREEISVNASSSNHKSIIWDTLSQRREYLFI